MRAIVVTRYSDAMPRRRRSARPTRRRRRWKRGCAPIRRCRPAARAGTTRIAERLAAGPAHRRPRRPRPAALHLGHDRPAEGLHAHASHADGQRRRRPMELRRRAASRWCSASCRCSTSPACSTACSARCTRAARCVLMPRWDRELAGRLISQHAISHWTCIPTMVIDLFGSPNYKSFDLSSLRSISGGGAAMPYAVAERLQNEFGLTFAEGYGLTETAAPSHANPPDRAKLQCLGIPIFCGRFARRRSAHARGAAARRGRRDHHARADGLHRLLEAIPRRPRRRSSSSTAARFFRTGDLGRMDEEGYFFITDRLKRMINASGFKVWPAEVEMLLYKHPAVQEACIIAARDAYRGETVKAVVVLRAEAKGKTDGRRHHRLGAREHGRLQGAEDRRVRRAAAEVGLGQGDVAAAAGPGSGALTGAAVTRQPRSSARRRARSARSRRARRRGLSLPDMRSTRASLLDAQHVERVLLAAAARRGRGAGLDHERRVAGDLVARRGVAGLAGVEVAGEQQVDAAAREHVHRRPARPTSSTSPRWSGRSNGWWVTTILSTSSPSGSKWRRIARAAPR